MGVTIHGAAGGGGGSLMTDFGAGDTPITGIYADGSKLAMSDLGGGLAVITALPTNINAALSQTYLEGTSNAVPRIESAMSIAVNTTAGATANVPLLTIAGDRAYKFRAEVLGAGSAAGEQAAAFEFTAKVAVDDEDAGTLGTITLIQSDIDPALAGADATFTLVGTSVRLTLTSPLGIVMRWRARVSIIELNALTLGDP